jgi:AraC-like DNA-binding protein
MERQVYQYLSRDSGMSQSKIQRLFKQYLKKAPLVPIRSKNHVHLLIDGSYFTNGLCLILYYDYDIQYVQLCRETSNEKLKEIKEDLQNFKRLGVDVYSVTCDSHSVILQAVEKTDPNAVIQRCLVHIRCQVQNYLSRKSKLDLHKWHEKNRHFVNEKTINEQSERWWYKHKNLHLATTHLIKAIRVMLIQLPGENISIPSFLYS